MIKLLKPLVDQKTCFDPDEVDDWSNVLAEVQGKAGCTFKFVYQVKTFTGAVTLTNDESQLCVVIDQPDVAFPSNMCLVVKCEDTCDPTAGEGETLCPDVEQELTDETKLAILGEDGCQVGHITYGALKKDILDSISLESLEFKFCDLFPDATIPQGDLVVSDRILTAGSDGCSLKSVSQDDLKCPTGDVNNET